MVGRHYGDLQAMYQHMTERGLSARTIRYAHVLMKGAMQQAVRWRLLLENPADGHSAATIALAAGVSPKVVSEQLGHASTAFTLDTYAHFLPHMQDEAAARVEAMLLGTAA